MVKNGKKKIWVFSGKDFLEWPRPPPLLTESKKKTVFYASSKCYKLRHPIFAKMNACLNFGTVEHWDYISQYPTSFQGWKSGPWWTPPHSKEWRRRCPCCWTVPPLWPWTWTGQCPFCGWNKTIVGLSKRWQKQYSFDFHFWVDVLPPIKIGKKTLVLSFE